MAFSLRLAQDIEAKIRRYADATGRSKSDVVREAVEMFVAAEITQAKFARTTLERLRPFIGAVTSGGGQFSTDTHEKYRAALVRKHRARDSR